MPSLHPPSQERRRNWVGALRGFARLPTSVGERCDLCGQPVAALHTHLIELKSRRFLCACTSCAARSNDSTAQLYRAVPQQVRSLIDFRMSDAEWDALMIPIGLAFFFRSEDATRVSAMYPGPAGAVESLLDLSAWQALVAANPELLDLRPQVEALLVYRVKNTRRYYIAPIDRCYALAGLMRQQWRGFSGGAAVWESIERFFAELQSCIEQPVPVRAHG
jgi:Family of unknown function (DUF5947)